jgi:DNA-binding response OmpR family regulator
MHQFKNTKLVLIDNNLFNLELNLQFLKLVGYTNITIYNDIESFKKSSETLPQLIIIDRNTPESLTFIQEIKKSNPDIYIIVLIDKLQLNDGQKSIEFGAFDYIIKDEETVSKIKTVLTKVQSVSEILETNKFTPKQKIFRLITFI